MLKELTQCYIKSKHSLKNCLARSAKLPEGIYILPTVISFFLSFLMISRRQIISRSDEPIFTIFTSNEIFLGVDDRSGPLFSISQGTLPWQPILCKKWQTPHFRSAGIQKRNGITLCTCGAMALIKLYQFDLLWIYCGFVVQFVVQHKLTACTTCTT